MSTKFSVLLLFTFMSTNIFGQTEKLNEIFEKYQDTEGITSIKIAKPMFRLLNSMKIDDADLQKIQPIISKMKGLKILIIDNKEIGNTAGKNFVDTKKLQQDIFGAVKSLNFDELMTVNNKDNKIKFLAQNTHSDMLDNLLLNIISKDSNVLMMMDGQISMDDVSKLINETQSLVKETEVKVTTPIKTPNASSQVRQVGNFNGIYSERGISVVFTQDNQPSVKVETEPGKEHYITTKVESGILRIEYDNHGERNVRMGKMLVHVSNPKLETLNLESGSNFKTTNEVKGNKLALNMESGSAMKGSFAVSGNAIVNLESGASMKIDLVAQNLNFNGESGMSANISGKAEKANYNIESGASCNASNFETKTVVADVSTGSSLNVFVTESLNVNVSAAASVGYKGNPKNITSNVSKITGARLKKLD